MTAFFPDVLGLPERLTQGDWTISQLPTGSFDFAEVYGADLRDERLMPKRRIYLRTSHIRQAGVPPGRRWRQRAISG